VGEKARLAADFEADVADGLLVGKQVNLLAFCLLPFASCLLLLSLRGKKVL
jgi:hypothetical protein